MEDSSTTDATLALYRDLVAEGVANVSVVLQAALKRTEDDARELAGANVRTLQGHHRAGRDLVPRLDDIRASFARTLHVLLEGGCYVGIATHDEWLVERALEEIRERQLTPDRYEFQMLLGVRRDLGNRLVADGHRLRIYVPFGRQWYEYSLRRLQENPKVAGYVAGDVPARSCAGR